MIAIAPNPDFKSVPPLIQFSMLCSLGHSIAEAEVIESAWVKAMESGVGERA